MVNSFYTKRNMVSTELSGGRQHFSYRKPMVVLEFDTIETSFGDTPHTVAQAVLGTDTLWWVVADVNATKDPFKYGSGDEMKVPYMIVENIYNKPKLF